MTETDDSLPPALQRTLDVLLAVLCLGLAAIAIGYEATTTLTAVAHEHVATDMKVADWFGVGGMTLMAPYAYLLEWADRHNRLRAKFWRRIGWSCQAILLAMSVSGAADSHMGTVIPLAVMCVGTGAGMWAVWMRTQLLPPKDQAVIDQLIVEQEIRQAQAVRAVQQRRREARLQRIAARYQPKGGAVPGPVAENAVPSYPWPIPDGKHSPLVYFIGNGSRVKIGTTSSLRSRVSALSLRASDVVLLLDGDRRTEQDMHKRFAAQRVGSTEWFENAGPLADFIRGHNEQALAAAKQEV